MSVGVLAGQLAIKHLRPTDSEFALDKSNASVKRSIASVLSTEIDLTTAVFRFALFWNTARIFGTSIG